MVAEAGRAAKGIGDGADVMEGVMTGVGFGVEGTLGDVVVPRVAGTCNEEVPEVPPAPISSRKSRTDWVSSSEVVAGRVEGEDAAAGGFSRESRKDITSSRVDVLGGGGSGDISLYA